MTLALIIGSMLVGAGMALFAVGVSGMVEDAWRYRR
jgi:hypothetical protein